ncbi:TspO/MBR family protein [Georgenia subflava]|uniref:Tryptophan-rich sensory protein n=1 Tax=Georgenia subflava TaxID=1622177 RepID=A0A6N7EI95_9MICO|nr:tryptophan-rich sensory protein [Georgenia subflava]MPV37859.1 tryptophan-rich sensory protein [Georgenia subflava]
MRSTEERAARPRVRQVVVTLAYLVCLVGSVVGVGAFGGTPIAEAAGGLLAADSTHLAPGSGAFSIWTVIYVGLGLYTVWQWWDRDDARRLAPLIVASLLLNAAWILVVQAGWVWLSVLVIVALLAVLAAIFVRLVRTRPGTVVEAAVVDGTFGLYLGWVAIATCANVAAALAGAGFTGAGAPEWWAVGVLVVATLVGLALAVFGRGRLAPAASLGWGLAWIAVARTTGDLLSQTTAVMAGLACVLVVVGTVAVRGRRALGAPHGRPVGPS